MTDPLQPRWLCAQSAARYVEQSESSFRALVRSGRLPAATYHLGKQSPRWDRLALDRAMGGAEEQNGMERILDALDEQAKREAEDRKKEARGRNDQGVQLHAANRNAARER